MKSAESEDSFKHTDNPIAENPDATRRPQPVVRIARPALRSKLERASAIVACVAILSGFGLFVYGEQAVGIGQAGAINKLVVAIGLGIFSIGTIIVAVWLSKWLVGDFAARDPQERMAAIKLFFKQLLAVALNILVYGGVIVLTLGSLTALDGASIGTFFVVLVTWAACILVFIFYRKFRKKHKYGYNVVGYVAMPLFLFIFGIACAVLFFGQNAAGAIKDLQDGPKEVDVLLVKDKLDHPAAYYAMVAQTKHVLTFYTAEEERIVLEVPDSDIGEVVKIDEYDDFVHLTYYPNTQVFCDATPWPEGRKVMGEALFQELRAEYGFDI